MDEQGVSAGLRRRNAVGKKSILLEIQDTVIRYAEIMSKISGVDVEVVDENLFRVAGMP